MQADRTRFRRWVTLAGAYASAAVVPALVVSGLALGAAGLARAGPAVAACGAFVAVIAATLERRRADHAEERVARIRARLRATRFRAEEELTGLRRQVRLLEGQLWDRRWLVGEDSAAGQVRRAGVVDLRGIARPVDPPVTVDPAELDDRVYAELEAAAVGDELAEVMEPGRRPPPATRPATRPAGRAAGAPRDRPGKGRTA